MSIPTKSNASKHAFGIRQFENGLESAPSTSTDSTCIPRKADLWPDNHQNHLSLKTHPEVLRVSNIQDAALDCNGRDTQKQSHIFRSTDSQKPPLSNRNRGIEKIQENQVPKRYYNIDHPPRESVNDEGVPLSQIIQEKDESSIHSISQIKKHADLRSKEELPIRSSENRRAILNQTQGQFVCDEKHLSPRVEERTCLYQGNEKKTLSQEAKNALNREYPREEQLKPDEDGSVPQYTTRIDNFMNEEQLEKYRIRSPTLRSSQQQALGLGIKPQNQRKNESRRQLSDTSFQNLQQRILTFSNGDGLYDPYDAKKNRVFAHYKTDSYLGPWHNLGPSSVYSQQGQKVVLDEATFSAHPQNQINNRDITLSIYSENNNPSFIENQTQISPRTIQLYSECSPLTVNTVLEELNYQEPNSVSSEAEQKGARSHISKYEAAPFEISHKNTENLSSINRLEIQRSPRIVDTESNSQRGKPQFFIENLKNHEKNQHLSVSPRNVENFSQYKMSNQPIPFTSRPNFSPREPKQIDTQRSSSVKRSSSGLHGTHRAYLLNDSGCLPHQDQQLSVKNTNNSTPRDQQSQRTPKYYISHSTNASKTKKSDFGLQDSQYSRAEENTNLGHHHQRSQQYSKDYNEPPFADKSNSRMLAYSSNSQRPEKKIFNMLSPTYNTSSNPEGQRQCNNADKNQFKPWNLNNMSSASKVVEQDKDIAPLSSRLISPSHASSVKTSEREVASRNRRLLLNEMDEKLYHSSTNATSNKILNQRSPSEEAQAFKKGNK